MPLRFSELLRNDILNQIVDRLDLGAGAGEIRLYTGVQPTNGGALSGNVLLGTLVLSDPSGTVATGVLTLDTIADDTSADATGTLTWCRAVDSDSNHVFDADAGIAGSGATLIFNTTSIQIGGVVRITSGTITEGNT